MIRSYGLNRSVGAFFSPLVIALNAFIIVGLVIVALIIMEVLAAFGVIG